MLDSAPKGLPHAATGHRGPLRPSPIYREYFMDLLPFEGHAGRADAPLLPVTVTAAAGPRDAEG